MNNTITKWNRQFKMWKTMQNMRIKIINMIINMTTNLKQTLIINMIWIIGSKSIINMIPIWILRTKLTTNMIAIDMISIINMNLTKVIYKFFILY